MFPIPKGAQIDKFSMDINGKQMEAELLDADKARQIYEDIVRKMKDPALLEYAGQSMLKLRIFPIEPRSEKRIKLKYTQLLKNDNGLVDYLYPLNTEKFSSAPIQSVSVKVELETKHEIKSLYSPSHEVEIKRRDANRATVGFEAKNVKPDTDFQLFFSTESRSDVSFNALAWSDGSDDGAFALMISPRWETDSERVIRKDIVFVVDTSGSMAEGHKLDQAKKALLFCLKNLNRGDRFEIVRFATEAEPLFSRLKDATDENLDLAEQFVKNFKPIGGTAIEEALVKAIEPAKADRADRDRPYTIVFLTDGKPTVGETDEDRLVAKVAKEIGDRRLRVFCFGIGADLNTHLLDKLTERTRGASQYVLPEEDIEVKVSNFYTKIREPVLANLNLRFSGVRVSKTYPSDLPDIFKGEQLVVFGRYSGDGDIEVELEGSVNGRTRTYNYSARFPKKDTSYEFIPRLWATRRVGYLLDQIRLNGESKELRDEITELARKYGIVTPFTAYLIVEDETRRDVPVASRTLQAIDRDDGAREEVSSMYRTASEAKEGFASVGSAGAFDSLKRAQTVEAPAQANVSFKVAAKRDFKPAADRAQQMVQSQRTRNIANRTFYQNGSVWIDSSVQSRKTAKLIQVKFNSDDYFSLMKKHADAAQWLSVGKNIQLVIEDKVYEIVE